MERKSRHLSTARLDRADAQLLLASKCVAPSQLCTQMPAPPHSLHVLLSIFCSQMPVPPHAPPPYLLVLAGARPAALLALAPLPLALADAFAPAELAARSFVVVQAPRLTRLDRLGWRRPGRAKLSRAWPPAANSSAASCGPPLGRSCLVCALATHRACRRGELVRASGRLPRAAGLLSRVRQGWRWRLRRLGR